MSDHGLCRVDNNILCRVSESQLDRLCLEQVIVMCACSVRVDVIDLLRSHLRLFHCELHCHTRALSVFCRRSDMVGIACRSVSHELSIDLRASRLRVLQRLENNDTGTLAQNKSVPVLVKRAGSMLRIICC